VVREGKRLPFLVNETATFNISLGEGANVEEVDGNTVPSSWDKIFEELNGFKTKPVTVMVLGTVDSGKTSFCTYMVNKLVQQKRKVAILDGDLGQSDIGPPGAIAFTFVTKPTPDLFSLEAKKAFFIGATSPNSYFKRVIEGLAHLKKEIMAENPDFLIVDTDGWVGEENAVYYKIRLVEELNPDLIIGIQQKEELTTLFGALEKFRKIVAEYPSALKERSREKRRGLRELGYIKYMKNAKVQSLPLNWIKIQEDQKFGLNKTHVNFRQTTVIGEIFGTKPLHLAELRDRICIVIGEKRWISSETITKVEELTKKKVSLSRKGEEKGILAGLCNAKGEFLGIGIVQEIDFARKALKILTPVTEEIATVRFGKIRLDKNMKEIQPIEEDQMDFAMFKRLF
jgi:polynucleotide 5'-hydroxyl-kinase GRC3/NOL9